MHEKMKKLAAIFISIILAACAKEDRRESESRCVWAQDDSAPERRVQLIGVASDLPDHAEKANHPGIIVDGKEIIFRGDYVAVPPRIYGKRIKVTGNLKKQHLPMFIWDPKWGDGEPQGIPMPPGTDIEKKSEYLIILNPKWEVVE
jgi:hypothetical protein